MSRERAREFLLKALLVSKQKGGEYLRTKILDDVERRLDLLRELLEEEEGGLDPNRVLERTPRTTEALFAIVAEAIRTEREYGVKTRNEEYPAADEAGAAADLLLAAILASPIPNAGTFAWLVLLGEWVGDLAREQDGEDPGVKKWWLMRQPTDEADVSFTDLEAPDGH